MAIETLKENLYVNQIIGKVKENILAEGDVVIPDIKPDILSSIDANGEVCIYKKEIADGKIRIDGGVQVYMIYLADDENGNVRGLNTVIDFSKVIEIENAKPEMDLESKICLKDIECRILNGRKVNIKASIDIDINVYSNENIEFISGIKNRDDIQLLSTTTLINSLLGNGSTKVYAKDTINIDATQNLVEILKFDINVINKEEKISYNKILAKADMQVDVVYLTEDNSVNEVKWKIPVMGFIDMQNISDENLCNISYEIKNILVKPNSVEEHSIYVEVEFEISCNAYETKELEVVEDLYSPTDNLFVLQKNIVVMQDKRKCKSVSEIKERISVPELSTNNLCNIQTSAMITKQNVYTEKVLYDGEVEIKVIYMSSITNRIEICMKKIPFNVNVECDGISSISNIITQVDILSQNCVVTQDGYLDVNLEIQLDSDISKMTEVKVIDNLEISNDNDEKIYSIVVYFVKPGDTLWNIAKKFKSTIKAIASVNGIENEENINVGQQLFIPKFV